MFVWRKAGEFKYLEIKEFAEMGIQAIFTSRRGGSSSGKFRSLNMGFHTGDDPENVRRNRHTFCAKLGFDYRNLVGANQIHSDRIHIVSTDDKGKGALNLNSSLDGIDALITDKRNIPLILLYADCVPLFIVDPINNIIGLAHAGWRGTVLKIGAKVISKMQEVYGTSPENVWVGIGPSISRENYEVDKRVVDRFKKAFKKNWKDIITVKGKGYYNLDLWLSNRIIFEETGISADKIIISNYCTFADDEMFYSYRRDNGKTGRMAAIIKF